MKDGILKILKGPLSTLGKKNRNGRIYSKELWQNVLNSEYWKDMMANHSLCGEVVHPGDERSESDSFEIDTSKVSHRIKEAHIEGDKLMGTVEILDTVEGRNLASLVNAGVTVGISARGIGDLDGDTVDPYTYQLKTFDITLRPSDPNARLVPLTESQKLHFNFINEADESDVLILKESTDYISSLDNSTINKNDEYYDVLNKIISTTIEENKNADNIDFKNIKLLMMPTTSDTNRYKVIVSSYNDKLNKDDLIVGYASKDMSNSDLHSIAENIIEFAKQINMEMED